MLNAQLEFKKKHIDLILVFGAKWWVRVPENREKNPTFLVPEPEKWYPIFTQTRHLVPFVAKNPGRWKPDFFATRTHH